MGKTCRLSFNHSMRLLELEQEIEDFKSTIPDVLVKLRDIEFKDIDFTPTANWLLKKDNYFGVLNGEFEKKTTTTKSNEDFIKSVFGGTNSE